MLIPVISLDKIVYSNIQFVLKFTFSNYFMR